MQPHAGIEISPDLTLSGLQTAELVAPMPDTGQLTEEGDTHLSALQDILHAKVQPCVVPRHDPWVSDETPLQMIQIIRPALLCCRASCAQLQVMGHHNKPELAEPCHTLCTQEDGRPEAPQSWGRKKVHEVSRLSIPMSRELMRGAQLGISIGKGSEVMLDHSAIIGLP